MVSFPLDTDEFMTTLVELLKAQGETKAVAVLAAADPTIVLSEYEGSYNDSTIYWHLSLALPPRLYVQVEPERSSVEGCIGSAAADVMRGVPGADINSVAIVTKRVSSEDWRADAKLWLQGVGVNNQGRVRSDNLPTRVRDGLLFRSDAEIRLYDALRTRGVSFAPLPVFIRGGSAYRRIEPDFIVVRDRVMMAVEVDGDTIHHETPVEAQNRLKMLTEEGVQIERVAASECATDEAARKCADRLLVALDKQIGRVVR